jgi:hypothetical protein
VYPFTGESFAQVLPGRYVVLFIVYVDLKNTFGDCRVAISSWYNKFRHNVLAVCGEVGNFNYRKALEGWWLFCPRLIMHQRLNGGSQFWCEKCFLAGTFHMIIDGLSLSVFNEWIIHPVNHDVPNADVHTHTVTPQSVQENADLAAYLVPFNNRKDLLEYCAATKGLHVVVPPRDEEEVLIVIPETMHEGLNQLLNAFYLPTPPRSNAIAHDAVCKLIFDTSGPSYMDSVYNGTNIPTMVDFLTQFLVIVTAWASDPASVAEADLLQSLDFWRSNHQYGSNIAQAIWNATWLPTRPVALQATVSIFLDVARAIFARPSYSSPKNDSCAACQVLNHVYAVALRRFDRQSFPDAIVEALRQSALEAAADNGVPLPAGTSPASVKLGEVVRGMGNVYVVHCASPTRAAAWEFIQTQQATGTCPADEYDARVIADNWDKTLDLEAVSSLWPAAPAVARPCVYFKNAVPTPEDADPVCNKYDYSSSRSKLGPGAMTFVCMHGILLGYILMHVFENAQFIMDELQRRFPFCPDLLVYDLACNLHKFMLARDHHYVRDALFVLDRFHTCNHRACSHGYRASEHVVEMDGINTEAAEQFNNVLAPLKKCLQGMTFQHHMWMIELFGHHHNSAVNAAARA